MNDLVKVRKYVTITEEVLHDGGPGSNESGKEPRRAAAVLAAVANPYAGRYEPDILPMMEALKPLGLEMSARLIDALGGDPSLIESYGKGAIVGEAGEVEHGALWHVPGGYAMRDQRLNGGQIGLLWVCQQGQIRRCRIQGRLG